jgi:hypothetical protein
VNTSNAAWMFREGGMVAGAHPGCRDYATRMEEEASFEARAVLAPRRARRARFPLLLPVVALVVIVWTGVSGARSDQATAVLPDPGAVAAASLTPEGSPRLVAPEVRPPQRPAQVVGINVQRLDAIQQQRLGRDDIVAVAGWYIATAITDCPPLAAIFRKGSLPEVRGDIDEWAFCVRSGVLYASRPNLDERLPTNNLEDNRAKSAGLPAVAVTLVIGVIAPLELEMIGGDATEVVVIGRFVDSGDACGPVAGCRRVLVVDHVGWARVI